MTHVACKSKLRTVVRSSMFPCPGKWVAIGCAVVYCAQTAHAFSAIALNILVKLFYDPSVWKSYKTHLI